ncbi:MAG: hypothetical protein B6245_09240 [Desulfobacteraceae bacterium 4572_88]|nr:MAG: hypothetical protein B6245_09240 [Desulfobacteraceae bacterium 4572_88]
MQTVTLEIPDVIWESHQQNIGSVREEVRLGLVIWEYLNGRLTIGDCGEILKTGYYLTAMIMTGLFARRPARFSKPRRSHLSESLRQGTTEAFWNCYGTEAFLLTRLMMTNWSIRFP